MIFGKTPGASENAFIALGPPAHMKICTSTAIVSTTDRAIAEYLEESGHLAAKEIPPTSSITPAMMPSVRASHAAAPPSPISERAESPTHTTISVPSRRERSFERPMSATVTPKTKWTILKQDQQLLLFIVV